MLAHLVNAEMYYHAKALERLSEVANLIAKIDEKQESDTVLEKLYK